MTSLATRSSGWSSVPRPDSGEGQTNGGRWAAESWPDRSNHRRHLLQVAYTDRLIGSVVKRLRDTGLYDPSLLVVTADHTMAFVPGQSSRARSPTPTGSMSTSCTLSPTSCDSRCPGQWNAPSAPCRSGRPPGRRLPDHR
ncbi:MAG TPA: sulfatase-like hydrolase/transferase [Actinomycetes bacterium]|nr:sulfatase-like hydrolase/transferase [Actinomycetes bacterium]